MAQRRAKNSLPIPKTDVEVNEYISTLSDAQSAIEKIDAEANKRVQQANLRRAELLEEHEATLKRYSVALFKYWEAHKDALTEGGKRQSVDFATGVIGQRITPPRTKLEDEAAIEDFVIKHGLTEFYTQKTTLRRDVMLANPDKAKIIPGVSFVQDRIVYVRPEKFDTDVELKKKSESVT